MAEGFFKRFLTRKNIVLGSQLAGLALAFSSKKFRGTAAEAVKTAGAALKSTETKAAAASTAVDIAKPAVKRATTTTKRTVKKAAATAPAPVKRAVKKAVSASPAPAKVAAKRVVKAATDAVAAEVPKSRGRPAKSSTAPVAPRKRRSTTAKPAGTRRPRTPKA